MTVVGHDDGTLRIALYSGIFVRGDAVSNSLSCKLQILRGLQRRGAALHLTVFTRHSDYEAPYIRSLDSVERLLRQDEFWDAHLHMFEFAMRYDLFDSVFVIPPDRPVVVTEHNTTPPDLVDAPIMKRECELSMVQRHNMVLARRVICDSEYNLELARSMGLPDERLTVIHLPPAHTPLPVAHDADTSRSPVRLLYVGRFVRAKGLPDLLAAAEALWGRGESGFTLTLAGNPAFSEETVSRDVSRFVERFGADGRAKVVLDPGDEDVAALFASSDALVIPSYHEGYCVPAVEALAARCFVIGYASGNLPNVLGGLGSLVPTGDVNALTDAISRFVHRRRDGDSGGSELPADLGDTDRHAWDGAVERHLRDYSFRNYETRFLELLADLSAQSPAVHSPCFGDVVSRRLVELTEGRPDGA
ncbi:MAG TPA: glycosyltransferase [Acidimicrobiales bacterium]|nr:glycosyltransferase [Acidimicrobiales bacterium]